MRETGWNYWKTTWQTKKVYEYWYMEHTFSKLDRLNFSIAVLSETKKKGREIEEVGNYIHIYSGINKEVRAKKGVSQVIRKKFKRCIKEWEYINESLVQVELKMMGNDIVIIGVYSPNDSSSDEEKLAFMTT
ncbi:hypothetical protein HHI36_004133 [Cryptolaemus montrouzieri]|uniref:Uncharacterized protein n=1 Tax=Cryptolaemus montrouzieri TaxID=559131 RepID=A0ABD2NQB2_9CUCU